MSHFTVLRTKLVDPVALIQALGDLGWKQVERHETPQRLQGYESDLRSQTAEAVIRRNHVGRLSNDIGCSRGSDGTFVAIISEYDRARYSEAWLDRLTQRYVNWTARTKLAEQGFDLVSEETGQDGRIHWSSAG